MTPANVMRVIGGRRYNTQTAEVLAGNDYWDGSNWERRGTNLFLFRAPGGAYFTQSRSQWEGADDGALTPVSEEEARALFENLRERRVEFEEAFPGAEVVDA